MSAATDNPEVPTIEAEEDEVPQEEKAEGSKKQAISLRVASEDLDLARELAGEMEIGYQVLLNQVIHEGLQDRQRDKAYRQAVQRVIELEAAQNLLNSPAVKAAQDLLATPAIKAAQDLLNSPAIKAAQEAAAAPIQKVRDFGSSTANKAAEDFATSPLAKAIKDLKAQPAFQAVQELAEGTSAKLQREWEKSPGGRLADAIRQTVDVKSPQEQIAELNKTVKDLQDVLKKAGLLQ